MVQFKYAFTIIYTFLPLLEACDTEFEMRYIELSRYFMDYDMELKMIRTYPIDICNAIPYNFIKYKCDISNKNKHIVTKYNHSIYYQHCNDPNPIITNFTIDVVNNNTYKWTKHFNSKSIYAFNCFGKDHYNKYNTYLNDLCNDYYITNGYKNITNLDNHWDFYELCQFYNE